MRVMKKAINEAHTQANVPSGPFPMLGRKCVSVTNFSEDISYQINRIQYGDLINRFSTSNFLVITESYEEPQLCRMQFFSLCLISF